MRELLHFSAEFFLAREPDHWRRKWVVYVSDTRKRQWLSRGEAGIHPSRLELHPKRQLDRLEAALGGEQDKIFFLHDNTRPHVTRETRKKTPVFRMIHPPYSPGLVPTDYDLFLSLSIHSQKEQFVDREQLEKCLAELFFVKTPGIV